MKRASEEIIGNRKKSPQKRTKWVLNYLFFLVHQGPLKRLKTAIFEKK